MIEQIAKELHIEKGDHEGAEPFHRRVLYSVAGRMAYASLFDDSDASFYRENDSTYYDIPHNEVSIFHVKDRINKTIDGYLTEPFLIYKKPIADVIEKQMRAAGVALHKDYYLCASAPSAASCGGITFYRGKDPAICDRISGLGVYEPRKSEGDIYNFFRIPKESLRHFAELEIERIAWNKSNEAPAEYAALPKDFIKDRWTDRRPEIKFAVGRSGVKGDHRYAIYRDDGAVASIDWNLWIRTTIAVYTMQGYPVMFRFQRDGAITHIRRNYFLPDEERAFYEYYSWPGENGSRIMTYDVFYAFEELMTGVGYQFKEVTK